MSTKLYVGNLPYNTNEESLSLHFSEVGKVVSARIIMDKMTGKSKGFAFVEMSSADEALAAIDKLNGEQFDGRTLRISEARPQEPRVGGGGGDRRPRGGNDSYGGGDRGYRSGGDRFGGGPPRAKASREDE